MPPRSVPIWLRVLQLSCVIGVAAFILRPQLVSDYPRAFTALVLVGIATGILSFIFAVRQLANAGEDETHKEKPTSVGDRDGAE
jgi:hypothetical protein